MYSINLKKWSFSAVLLFILAISIVPAVMAGSDNGAVELGIQPAANIIPIEVAMNVNCTWSHGNVPGYTPPAILGWDDSNTIPPLQGSGWSNQVLSINLSQSATVDLCITDAWSKGDYFEVYLANSASPTWVTLIGTTPIVNVSNWHTTTDPDFAFADSTYSRGTFAISLSAGKYYFAFREVGHHYGMGAFFVKFCAPLLSLSTKLDSLEAKVDAIEAKLDNPQTGLAEIKKEVQSIESNVTSLEGKIWSGADSLKNETKAIESFVKIIMQRLGLPVGGFIVGLPSLPNDILPYALGLLVGVGGLVLVTKIKRKNRG